MVLLYSLGYVGCTGAGRLVQLVIGILQALAAGQLIAQHTSAKVPLLLY